MFQISGARTVYIRRILELKPKFSQEYNTFLAQQRLLPSVSYFVPIYLFSPILFLSQLVLSCKFLVPIKWQENTNKFMFLSEEGLKQLH